MSHNVKNGLHAEAVLLLYYGKFLKFASPFCIVRCKQTVIGKQLPAGVARFLKVFGFLCFVF